MQVRGQADGDPAGAEGLPGHDRALRLSRQVPPHREPRRGDRARARPAPRQTPHQEGSRDQAGRQGGRVQPRLSALPAERSFGPVEKAINYEVLQKGAETITGLSKRNGAKLRESFCPAAASHSQPRQASA